MTHNINDLFQEQDEAYIEQFIERFWQKVDKPDSINGSDECWTWTAAKNDRGYGDISWARPDSDTSISLKVHRVSKYLTIERDISDWKVLHSCHESDCVNPNHIRLGTTQENSQDDDCATLSREDVIQIRRLGYHGLTQSEIADRFNVCREQISKVVNGVNWDNVTDGPIKGVNY